MPALEDGGGVAAGGVEVLGDEDALAGGEPVVLDHVRRVEAGERGVEVAGVVDRLAARGGHAGGGHDVLGERLRALDARRGGARPEAGDAGVAQRVADARDERGLGADDDEVGAPLTGQGDDLLAGGGVGEARVLGERGRAGVAGGGGEGRHLGVAGEGEEEGMLAGSGADDQDAHGRHATGARRGARWGLF